MKKYMKEGTISVGRVAMGGIDKINIHVETDEKVMDISIQPENFALALTSLNSPCIVRFNEKGT